jgi:NTP pyrophosphatase (non-canonical NTP hydrolase)
MSDLDELTLRLRDFARARDWERFHTPKNLAMALVAEAGELIEHFQWLTPEESSELAHDPEALAEVADEMADVAIYLLRLADVLGVDLAGAVRRKIQRNEGRFPAEPGASNPRRDST